jgi:hypothetical protein
MKRFPLKEAHIDQKCLKDNLGEDNVIFVGHTIDLFASDIPSEWIDTVLEHCCKYPKNRYLFQSKNPKRMIDFNGKYPPNVFFGTTIETNRASYNESKAPSYEERALALKAIKELGYETMLTIEPIFDFDLDKLMELILMCSPKWVNIGADSKGHRLPEPSKDKVVELIESIKKETTVEIKDNLSRLMKEKK